MSCNKMTFRYSSTRMEKLWVFIRQQKPSSRCTWRGSWNTTTSNQASSHFVPRLAWTGHGTHGFGGERVSIQRRMRHTKTSLSWVCTYLCTLQTALGKRAALWSSSEGANERLRVGGLRGYQWPGSQWWPLLTENSLRGREESVSPRRSCANLHLEADLFSGQV